jgi:hypothetical protein
MGQIAGSELLQQIQAIWQTDKQYVEDIENGFNWWPGHHKVTVRCFPKDDASDPDAWRLTVSTEFLKGVNYEDPKVAALIASMGSFSPSYGWVYTPSEVLKKYDLSADGTIGFHSATYVRPETASWLPAFFARIVLMQPIDAQRTADPYSEILQGKANKSGGRLSSGSSAIDDILNVAQEVFAPMGQEPSKWVGSDEFGAIAERYGDSETSFGTGGPDGVTLETPFGKSSSLIRLRHDITHPALGSGLLGTIRLPVFESLEASTSTCMWLNFFCSRHWTDAPVHGTWHPQEIRKDEFSASYGAFIPNALYADGVATNVALWSLWLARWARMKCWPDLQDDSIYDVLNARLDQFNAVNQKT